MRNVSINVEKSLPKTAILVLASLRLNCSFVLFTDGNGPMGSAACTGVLWFVIIKSSHWKSFTKYSLIAMKAKYYDTC